MRNTNEMFDNVYFVDWCINTRGVTLDNLYHLPRDCLADLYNFWLVEITDIQIGEVLSCLPEVI